MLADLFHITSMLDVVLLFVAVVVIAIILYALKKVANKILQGVLTTILGICIVYILYLLIGAEKFCGLGLCFWQYLGS